MKKQLTTEEIVYIAKNYEKKGPRELGMELGVDAQRVAMIASRLRQQGVPVPKRQQNTGGALKSAVEILKEGEKFNLFRS